MNLIEKRAMDDVYPMPIDGREDPPRKKGLTMVIDMGSDVSATKGLINFAGRYIDVFKISSGSAALYPERIIRKKIQILKENNIEVEAGGSHFEVALWKGKFKEYIKKLLDLKVDYVEIADGHLPLELSKRLDSIRLAKNMGIKVITEVGKKQPKENIKAVGIVGQVNKDLEAGADLVIIEGKASGKNVGIFNSDGSIIESELEKIIHGVTHVDKLMWEAPLREQQQILISKFGPNVNLGNIFPEEVYPLELLRNGLMLMPLINAYNQEMSGK
jgi:phosphosulfolactate synthase